MYLSSGDIRELLNRGFLTIEGDKKRSFNPEHQIGPCSVDLRLSNEFWVFKDQKEIDILDIGNFFKDSSSEDLYEKVTLQSEQSIEIFPKQLVLTHILEYIKMPTFVAGSLTGRSRYSRLGLTIHSTGSFINPGWKGYAPLQLINNNSVPIKIYLYLEIVQIIFILLNSIPDVEYQDLERSIFKKSDLGGPSLWFIDRGLQSLAYRLAQKKIT